jgi:hypothetical protein
MRTLVIGCAMAALLVSPAAAQGLGVGSAGAGLGVGLGAGANAGSGGMGAGANVGANVGGLGAGANVGGNVSGNVGARTGALGNAVGSAAATARQGAADVLPRTSASPTGIERGSRSSTNAAANAAGSFGANAAATTDIRSGALIKNTAGATVGRITQVLDATADAPARVVIQQGERSVTVPRSELSADGNFLVYSGAALR